MLAGGPIRLEDGESLLSCLELIDCSSSAYKIFAEIDGCSVKDSLWDAGMPGLSGCSLSNPAQLERVLRCKTVRRLEELKSYWMSSGNAAEAERFKRDFEKGKQQ